MGGCESMVKAYPNLMKERLGGGQVSPLKRVPNKIIVLHTRYLVI